MQLSTPTPTRDKADNTHCALETCNAYSGRVLMRREFRSFWDPGYFPSKQSAP